MDAALLPRIDFFRLALNLGGKPAIIHQMLDLFLASAAQTLEKMEAATREGDVSAWLKTAHHLKGAAKNITAKRLAGLCEEAEAIETLPHEQSAAVLYHLHKELAALHLAIHQHWEEKTLSGQAAAPPR